MMKPNIDMEDIKIKYWKRFNEKKGGQARTWFEEIKEKNRNK